MASLEAFPGMWGRAQQSLWRQPFLMKDRVPNTTDNLQSRRTGGVKAPDQCGQSLVNGKERRKVNVDMGLGQNRWHSIGQGKGAWL